MKIRFCPICCLPGLIQRDDYEDEYFCGNCDLSFEILVIKEK